MPVLIVSAFTFLLILPEFDVFISYRVQSDLDHAEIIYDKLTAAGLRVWWDKKSLAPGVPWQVVIISITYYYYHNYKIFSITVTYYLYEI